MYNSSSSSSIALSMTRENGRSSALVVSVAALPSSPSSGKSVLIVVSVVVDVVGGDVDEIAVVVGTIIVGVVVDVVPGFKIDDC